jgi:hypothetical protein
MPINLAFFKFFRAKFGSHLEILNNYLSMDNNIVKNGLLVPENIVFVSPIVIAAATDKKL